MVWQFWGRAAERVLSLIARDVFFAVKNVSPEGATRSEMTLSASWEAGG